jgi:hypothetical protein
MLPDTAEALSRQGTELTPGQEERLNPQLDSVQVGDRLRLTLSLGGLDYAREFLCTSFPIICTPGAYVDLGPYLQPDPSTAAFDFASGWMTIEADVIREESPGVLLLVVLAGVVIALAAIFPNATVVAVDRIKRAFQAVAQGAAEITVSVVQPVAKGAGQIAGSVLGQATSGLAQGLGIPTVLLVGVGLLALVMFTGPGQQVLRTVEKLRPAGPGGGSHGK